MAYLAHVGWKPTAAAALQIGDYPFSVPAVRTLDGLDLDAPVTFLVGENGSGKSTILEALAIACELPSIGEAEPGDDRTLGGPRALAAVLRLGWHRRTRQGFFLRAEDFFGHLRRRARDDARIAREKREAGMRGVPNATDDDTRDAERDERDAEHADEVASAAYIGRYDNRSHGESFLELFTRRLQGGLYLLDEPEAPLSPARQLTLLAMLGDAARRGAQLVVATHSPILLALPGARIYDFDTVPVRETPYAELPHVTLTREFLAAPERYLRHLSS